MAIFADGYRFVLRTRRFRRAYCASLILPCIAIATAALVGCSSLGGKSGIEKDILAQPDPAFMKKVKNDPFPSAAEQGLSASGGATKSKR